MLIATETMLAMHCSSCGKLEFHKLSRFAFSGNRMLSIYCSCGSLKLIIKTRKKGTYWLQMPCVACENMHLHTVPSSWWQEQQIIKLFCPEIGIELGYIGPAALVSQLVAEDEEYMLNEIRANLFDDEYSQVAEVTSEASSYIYRLAEKGYLYCQCGNSNIEISIFSDRLELYCKHCGSIGIVYTETKEDLLILQQMEKIELSKSNFIYLDSLANTQKSKKTKRKKNDT